MTRAVGVNLPRVLRRVSGSCLQLVALPLGALAFAVVSLAAATVLDSPALLIASGVLASLLLSYLCSRVAWWLIGAKAWRRNALVAGAFIMLLCFLGVYGLLLQPLIAKEEQFRISVPPDVERWSLDTGSDIAVRRIAAKGNRKPYPIVFLHGGPGAYGVSLQPTVQAIAPLSQDGYDVYFYDQVGGGLSGRLDDVAHYTVDRHLRDLNAVYERIGAQRIVLIGSSWGASLGTSYMARHPEHVIAAVFSGVGPIFHPAWAIGGDGGLDEQLSPAQRSEFSAMVETPRLFAALALAEVNPKAAARFASEGELGALFDKVANTFYLQKAVCDLGGLDVRSAGYGFWSNRMTGRSLQARTDDPRPALRENHTPVLVLRGECDYKREGVALEYHQVFANAEYEAIANTGHMLLWERPDLFLQRVRDFLGAVTSTPSR